ncbi:MAG: hypothetical protein PF487_13165 [Bacteroidales bacterium]|jgi:hypothetical protein|nr:hypothetical protein [Bacteroidales bacterium]
MKTTIRITGQPQGNFTLKTAITSCDCDVNKYFQDYKITFKTKKDAVKALNKAYKELKNDEPEYAKGGGINYMLDHSLEYDASKAVIES